MLEEDNRWRLIAAGGFGILVGAALTLLIGRVLPRAMAAAMTNMMSGMLQDPDGDSDHAFLECRRMMRALIETDKEMEE